MTDHQIWATAVVVWLLGLFTAWCLGYAARNRHDPAQRSNLTGQLARVRLDDFNQLDGARLHCQAHRLHWETHRLPAPAPVAVHVHVAAPLPWPPHQPPTPLGAPRLLDAMPVLPVKEVQS